MKKKPGGGRGDHEMKKHNCLQRVTCDTSDVCFIWYCLERVCDQGDFKKEIIRREPKTTN